MKKLSRRKFLQTTTSLATVLAAPVTLRADDERAIKTAEAAASSRKVTAEVPPPGNDTGAAIDEPAPVAPQIDLVPLGNTGLRVSRIAFGTGTVAVNRKSHQTRIGHEKFGELARYAYARGVRFFDMADSYGSHEFVGRVAKTLPRDKIILSTKVWTHDDTSGKAPDVRAELRRMLGEIGAEQLDIFILHCLMRGGWTKSRRRSVEAMQQAKADGLTRTIGVSCHNWDALVEAVETPWVDVIFARINPFGEMMDNKPEVVVPLLRKAVASGKGIVGMKIFAEGKRVAAAEREASLKFALQEAGVTCVTLGMENNTEIDDAVERVLRLAPKA